MTETAHQDVMHFLRRCQLRLETLASSSTTMPRAAGAAAALKAALDNATPIDYTPVTVPVLASSDAVADTPLARECVELKESFVWAPSFRMTDEGTTAALMTVNQLFDLGDVLCGFMYLDANEPYPEHEHEPQELYMILSGRASWLHGGNEVYEDIESDSIIYNHPFDRHGVRAGAAPLLAMYVLWPEH